MNQEKVSVKVVPDTRVKKANERFPLKLRISYKGSRRYYSIGHDTTPEEWATINSANAKGELRKIKQDIFSIENEAQQCCAHIRPFSFKHFQREFFYEKKMFQSLQSTYNGYIQELKENNQDGTATGYQTSLNSFLQFNPRLDFDDITVEFLK